MDAEDPGIEDLAPTALGLFGIEAPAWMEGKTVIRVIALRNLVVGAGDHRRPAACVQNSRAKRVIVIGVDGMDPGFVEAALGGPAESGAAAGAREFLASGDDDASAESGGMVDIFHRPRSGAARDFRFRPPRSANHGAAFIDG